MDSWEREKLKAGRSFRGLFNSPSLGEKNEFIGKKTVNSRRIHQSLELEHYVSNLVLTVTELKKYGCFCFRI